MRSGATDRLITVGEELTIGRGVEGDGGLPDDRKVSRRHARFLLGADGVLLVEDLRSANGTSVNGVALEPGSPRELRAGDIVAAGNTTFEVRGPDGAAPADPVTEISTVPYAPEPETVAKPVEQQGSPSSMKPPPAAAEETPLAAEVLHEGRRVPIGSAGVTIGADPACDVVVDARNVAGRHAVIRERDGRH